MCVPRPGGTLHLSWRVAGGERDRHGRLSVAIDPQHVVAELGASQVLVDEAGVSASSGKAAHRIVVRKQARGPAREMVGVARIRTCTAQRRRVTAGRVFPFPTHPHIGCGPRGRTALRTAYETVRITNRSARIDGGELRS